MANRRIFRIIPMVLVSVFSARVALAAPPGVSDEPFDPQGGTTQYSPETVTPCRGTMCGPVVLSDLFYPEAGTYPLAEGRVHCPAGTRPIGGGVRISGLVTTTRVYTNSPDEDNNGNLVGWIGKAVADKNTKPDWWMTVYAICAGLE